MTPSQRHAALIDAMLGLAWSQWTTLGVAGIHTATHSIVVDPEALLVATMSVGRWDARLFDEVVDWVACNSAMLDAARLRRLAAGSEPEQRRLMTAVLQLAARGGARPGLKRVESDLIAREETADYGVQPLFRSQDGGSLDWAVPDEIFAAAGFSRSQLNFRGLSRRPNASTPACLRFRARALVGVGARAEVLTYLWTHEWAHGRLIAERSAYNQSPVAEYLAALAASGLAEKRTAGRRTEYRLVTTIGDVGRPAPAYVAWDTVLPAITRVAASLDSTSLSDDALWSRFAATLEAERRNLASEGFNVHVPDLVGWTADGTQLLEAVGDAILDRVQRLGE